MNFQPKFDSGVPVPELLTPEEQDRRSRRILFRLSLVGFVTALVARAVDPIVPPIAAELGVDPKSVALLSTAFAPSRWCSRCSAPSPTWSARSA